MHNNRIFMLPFSTGYALSEQNSVLGAQNALSYFFVMNSKTNRITSIIVRADPRMNDFVSR